MMYPRATFLESIEKKCAQFPVTALLGPRQCGKTTLAMNYAEILRQNGEKVYLFDLEDPEALNALQNPKLVLERLDGLVILDEIQRMPNLFPLLRVMVDHFKKRYLILGSASQELIQQSSETLAGRIDYIEVTPFRLSELDQPDLLWLRGGFPLSVFAHSHEAAQSWIKAYTRTFLERDIPSFGFDLNPELVRRFWGMLCGYHGQIFNASALGNALDLNHKTVRKYLDILTGTFMIRTLQPWFTNIQKRQVKSPKIYFRDTGIFHSFLNISSLDALLIHHQLGASWEGFALEEVISASQADPQSCFFWATHSGAEVDLLLSTPTQLEAFEFKFTNTPKITRSMVEAMKSLNLEKMTIIVPSAVEYPLSETVNVIGLSSYIKKMKEK